MFARLRKPCCGGPTVCGRRRLAGFLGLRMPLRRELCGRERPV